MPERLKAIRGVFEADRPLGNWPSPWRGTRRSPCAPRFGVVVGARGRFAPGSWGLGAGQGTSLCPTIWRKALDDLAHLPVEIRFRLAWRTKASARGCLQVAKNTLGSLFHRLLHEHGAGRARGDASFESWAGPLRRWRARSPFGDHHPGAPVAGGRVGINLGLRTSEMSFPCRRFRPGPEPAWRWDGDEAGVDGVLQRWRKRCRGPLQGCDCRGLAEHRPPRWAIFFSLLAFSPLAPRRTDLGLRGAPLDHGDALCSQTAPTQESPAPGRPGGLTITTEVEASKSRWAAS